MLAGWYADRAGPSDVEQLEMRALCRLELMVFHHSSPKPNTHDSGFELRLMGQEGEETH